MADDELAPDTVNIGKWPYDPSDPKNEALIVFINPFGRSGSGKSVLAFTLQAPGSPLRLIR